MTSPRSIDSLTSLRGLAALWIVAYHFWTDVLVLFPALEIFSPFVREGHSAVPLFFVLSGFVLAYNYAEQFHCLQWDAYRRFVTRRLARIYPVHLFTLLVVLVLVGVAHWVSGPITDSGYTLATFVQNLFLVQTWVPQFELNWNYPAWSISSEWFAYLWFPVLASVVLRRLASVAAAAALLVLAWIGSILVYTAGPVPFRELVVVIPTFIAGATACTLWRRGGHGRYGPRWLPDVCAALIVVVPFVCSGTRLIATYLSLFVVLMLTLPTWRDACSRFWRWPAAVFLGEVSYSLYMTHTVTQKVCHAFLPASRFQESAVALRISILAVYAILIT